MVALEQFTRRVGLRNFVVGAGGLLRPAEDITVVRRTGDDYKFDPNFTHQNKPPESPPKPEKASVSFHCPILMYHEVWNSTTFANQILGYVRNGYQAIGVSELARLLQGEEVKFTGRPFMITLDDTLKSQEDNAFPFLTGNNIKAVFAVMPDWKGDGGHHNYSTNSTIKMYAESGMDVVSHTFHHGWLTNDKRKDRGSWESQIVESRKRLEQIVGNGYKVEGFCYPYGDYDKETLDLVAKHYSIAFSTKPGTIQTTDGILESRRLSIT